MELKYALFLAFVGAFLAIRCVLYWAGRLDCYISPLILLLTGIASFAVICLFLMYAPEALLVRATIVFMAFVAITTIGIWITGG